jgi:hypothetical protein
LTTVQSQNPFLRHTEGANRVNKWIFWHELGILRFQIASSTLGSLNPVTAPWNPVAGQWYHVAVTRSGSAYALYIDGVQVAASINSLTVPDAATALTIGGAEAFFLNGLVDEARIHNVALSAAEIQAIAN